MHSRLTQSQGGRVSKSNQKETKARKRTQVACDRCRKRKIKCSGDPGDETGCETCKAAGAVGCQYARMRTHPIHIEQAAYGADASRTMRRLSSPCNHNTPFPDARQAANGQFPAPSRYVTQSYGYTPGSPISRLGGVSGVMPSRRGGSSRPRLSSDPQSVTSSANPNNPAVRATETLTRPHEPGSGAARVANMFANDTDGTDASTSSAESSHGRVRAVAHQQGDDQDRGISPTDTRFDRLRLLSHAPTGTAGLAPTSHPHVHYFGPTTTSNPVLQGHGTSVIPMSDSANTPRVRETSDLMESAFYRPARTSQIYQYNTMPPSPYAALHTSSQSLLPEPRAVTHPYRNTQSSFTPSNYASAGTNPRNSGFSGSGYYPPYPPMYDQGLAYNTHRAHDYAIPYTSHGYLHNVCNNPLTPGSGPYFGNSRGSSGIQLSGVENPQPFNMQCSASSASAISALSGARSQSSISSSIGSIYSLASQTGSTGRLNAGTSHHHCLQLPPSALRSELAKDLERDLEAQKRNADQQTLRCSEVAPEETVQ